MSTLATLIVKLTTDTSDYNQGLDSAEKKSSGFLRNVGGNIRTLGTVALAGLGAVGAAAVGAGIGIAKLAINAAPLEAIEGAFNGLNRSIGTTGDEMLTALKKGSAGMISQRDLMLSFNKAAQLVSTDFASQLPDAMQYLGKVAASTGQDMGYMLDSLVVGVGRLSGPILDNLGIQVALSEATGRAAEMFGVEESALTKAQTQAGMMNVVMQKLAANTESMPDVAGSASASMAALGATFKDIKDRVGLALVPALSRLFNIIMPFVDSILPKLLPLLDNWAEQLGFLAWAFEDIILNANPFTDLIEELPGWLQPIVSKIAMVIYAFQGFAAALKQFHDPLYAIQVGLRRLLGKDVADPIIQGITQIVETVKPFITMIVEWISNNVSLKDVLIALGIAIAAIVIPAMISIVTAAAPIIATGILLIAAVAAIRAAWETDWLGIRTFVSNAIQVLSIFIQTTIANILAWWTANGDAILAKAQAIWTSIQTFITTTLQALSAFIQTTIAQIQAYWAEHGAAILAKATEIWSAIKAYIDWAFGQIKQIFSAFKSAFEGDWYGFGEKLRGVWDEAWAKIKAIGETVWTAIKNFFSDTDWGSIGSSILDGIAKGISAGAGKIAEAAKNAARAALNAAKGFLGIKSPSAAFMKLGKFSSEGFALGMRDINPIKQAASALGRVAMAGTVNYGNETRSVTMHGVNVYANDARSFIEMAQEYAV